MNEPNIQPSGEAKALLQSCMQLLAIVRIQNGNLHEDINAIVADADKAIENAPTLLRENEELRRERDNERREREACHTTWDQILALCGYKQGESYPGIVKAVEDAIASRDSLKAALAALGETTLSLRDQLTESRLDGISRNSELATLRARVEELEKGTKRLVDIVQRFAEELPAHEWKFVLSLAAIESATKGAGE